MNEKDFVHSKNFILQMNLKMNSWQQKSID